ncbi:TPA: CynX/NimT family MFS transporter [Klebsiella pneumoniae]|nr:MFS transporter [Klebsiella pneumoniae]
MSGEMLSARKMIHIVAFVFFAINLRAPLTAISTVISSIKIDLHIASGLAGALTTIPVLCFGILVPLASAFLARINTDKAIFYVLWGIILGSLIRISGGFPAALLGTIVLGAALTVGNIAGVMVIARDFSQSAGIMTGVFVMSMSIGAMVTSAFTPPLSFLYGWRCTLGSWSFLALIAILLWWITIRFTYYKSSDSLKNLPVGTIKFTRNNANNEDSIQCNPTPLWKRPLIWCLTLVFSTHNFIFFGLIAWLPECLIQINKMNTNQAGEVASLFQILGIVGCFGIPLLKNYLHLSPTTLFICVGLSWLIMPTGLLFYPSFWLIWTIFGGFGSGGGYAVVFMAIIARSQSLDDNRRASSFVQGIGYILASISPVAMGGVHQLTGDWHIGLLMLMAAALICTISGLAASYYLKS